MKNPVAALKSAVTANDIKLVGKAIDRLRPLGYNYQMCYRIALAAKPGMTLPEWEDMMIEVDALDG